MTYLQKKFGMPTLVDSTADASEFAPGGIPDRSMVPADVEVASARYQNIDVELDAEAKT